MAYIPISRSDFEMAEVYEEYLKDDLRELELVLEERAGGGKTTIGADGKKTILKRCKKLSG
jgi:hypothetical protein